jgi:hypothetical protein
VLVLTLASELALYGNLSMLTRGAWVRTLAGLTFGLGALAAIVAAAIATFVAAPAVHRAIEAGDRVQAAGASAVPEDVAEMGRAETRYARTMRLVAGLLLGTAAAMAVARYLN